MHRRRALAHLLHAAALSAVAPALRAQPAADDARPPYPLRDDVRAFIDDAALVYGLDRAWIERAFAQARYSAPAEQLTTPGLAPAAARNWLDYRARHVDPRRVREGRRFLEENRRALARAARRYGVPAEIVTGILGIETHYGRQTGGFRTLDVLLTLSFDYRRRADFYREELLQFLLLCQEQGLDPLAPQGSFAGALGLPQFMPGSIRRWAIDFDGDGHVDLLRSRADAIGSVAHYLAEHGWQTGLPVQFPAHADAGVADQLGRGIVARQRWDEVAALGVRIQGRLAADAPVLLLDLPLRRADGSDDVEYRIGTVNMQALLHYNRSYFYGAAVADLAAAIRGHAG